MVHYTALLFFPYQYVFDKTKIRVWIFVPDNVTVFMRGCYWCGNYTNSIELIHECGLQDRNTLVSQMLDPNQVTCDRATKKPSHLFSNYKEGIS